MTLPVYSDPNAVKPHPVYLLLVRHLCEGHLDRLLFDALSLFFPVVRSFDIKGRARDRTQWLVIADAIEESESGVEAGAVAFAIRNVVYNREHRSGN